MIEWQGHQIDFVPVLSRRNLWMATANELWLDGTLAKVTGGFGYRDRTKAHLTHEGRSVPVVVESVSSVRHPTGLECTVTIDGEKAFEGVVKAVWRW